MSSGGLARSGHPSTTNTPLVVDPTDSVSVEMVKVGPGGTALAPVLVLPGNVRVCVDAYSADADAVRWWYDLGTAAMSASLCYPAGSGSAR
jgi:hypothetical protein